MNEKTAGNRRRRKCRVFEKQSWESNELSSYSPGWQRGSLCGCGTRPIPFIQLKTWTLAHQARVCQTAKMLGLASGAGVVCWGQYTLHIILTFVIFSRGATALTQSLFVSVCLLWPPTAPCSSTPLYWTHLVLGFHLAEEYQCANASLFPLRLSLWFSFVQKRFLAQRDVFRPHENLCLYFLKKPFCTDFVLQPRYLVWNHLGMTEHRLSAETFSDSFVCEAVGVKVWLTWLSCCGGMDAN